MAVSQDVFNLLKGEFKDNVKVSKISESIKGKVITIYGENDTGKSTQAANFPNPVFIPLEKGLNAISGAMVLPVTCWSDLNNHVRKLTGKKFKQALKDPNMVMTVIIDGLENAGKYIKKFLCEKYQVDVIGDARNGFGAWEEYANMMWSLVDRLTSIGYTVVFIGHPVLGEDGRFTLNGDSRVIKPILDNSDITVYLQSNGVDSEDNYIPSTAYLSATSKYFARTRFKYMERTIKEFTADNLIETMKIGIRKQNEIEGNESVDFEEQQDVYKVDETFEDVKNEIAEIFKKIQESDNEDLIDGYMDITGSILGEGVKISEVKPKHLDLLKSVRNELVEMMEEFEDEE